MSVLLRVCLDVRFVGCLSGCVLCWVSVLMCVLLGVCPDVCFVACLS